MKNLPKKVLKYESLLPKLEQYNNKLEEFIQNRIAFINVPRTMWILGEKIDKNDLLARRVPQCFAIEYKNQTLNLCEERVARPMYFLILQEIYQKRIKQMKSYLKNTRSNMGLFYFTLFYKLWILCFMDSYSCFYYTYCIVDYR